MKLNHLQVMQVNGPAGTAVVDSCIFSVIPVESDSSHF